MVEIKRACVHRLITGWEEPSLYVVKAMFILDCDGQRLVAKYYDETFPSPKEQRCFEKSIFNKTHRADGEIAFLEGMTIVYKSSIDLFFYVVGSSQENELMLVSVLTCLFESLSHMLRVILECDSQQVIQKLNFRTASEPAYGFVLFDYITGTTEQSNSVSRRCQT
ncbi:coatomer subunit zeta-2 isoform X5 [Microcaecilia unicolor]|uniref:Coatomer subunit zeta n=1 Tax=Microcaecilia unicolor TaxID=1415580 RepID=A0A6P7ZDA1_9AMPH|nr:coatomer subunit zeta-2 isoform X5 [Microcaecilia unicolor]